MPTGNLGGSGSGPREGYGSFHRPGRATSPSPPGGTLNYEILQPRTSSNAGSPSPPVSKQAVYSPGQPPDGSSQAEVVINVLKVCMGSGMLALPYAYVNGGYGFSIVGLVVIAAWNYYAIDRLLRCKGLLDQGSRGADDVDVNQTYAFIGRKALGDGGALAVDLCITLTLYGVCTTYLITATQLLDDTPLSMGLSLHPHARSVAHLLLCLCVVLPLSSARSLSLLSCSSLIGLVALALGFVVILGTGLWRGMWRTVDPSLVFSYLWPDSMQAFSRFFGVAAFCFGVPPLTFPLQGSMREPEAFPSALRWALSLVTLPYVALPGAVALLFSATQIQADIIQMLPDTFLAHVVRVSVALVCIMSYPLALVPTAQLLESIGQPTNPIPHRIQPPGETHALAEFNTPPPERGFFGGHLALRFVLIFSTAICASAFPCFGIMVALMGAFTVSLLSFVFPFLFHLSLFHSRLTKSQVLVDAVMVLVGLTACVASTWLTAESGYATIVKGRKCA